LKKNSIRAELWNIRIYGSVLDKVHGFYQDIAEIYIPKYGISFNFANGSSNLFKSEKSRYTDAEEANKIKDIEVDYQMVEMFTKYLELKDVINKKLSTFFIDL